MTHKFSFGLPEIFSIFGCWSLVLKENISLGITLICLSFLLAFCRFAMEIQKRTERSKSFDNVMKTFKTELISNKIMSKKFDGITH